MTYNGLRSIWVPGQQAMTVRYHKNQEDGEGRRVDEEI